MRLYWEAFDGLHARQRSGMAPLWGLVADKRYFWVNPHDHTPYQERLYEWLLPESLRDEIERLWGSGVLPCAPIRIVTEPFPHALMADAFGPALKFWHGRSLTAWFLCEGPYSRTGMAGLEEYHRRELAELAEMGAPVDRRLFSDLIETEKDLLSEEYGTEVQTIGGSTVGLGPDPYSGGFERFEEIITRRRRSWAEVNLVRYLKGRAEGEVLGVARVPQAH